MHTRAGQALQLGAARPEARSGCSWALLRHACLAGLGRVHARSVERPLAGWAQEAKLCVKAIFEERRNMAQSLQDTDSIVQSLERFLAFVVHYLFVALYLVGPSTLLTSQAASPVAPGSMLDVHIITTPGQRCACLTKLPATCTPPVRLGVRHHQGLLYLRRLAAGVRSDLRQQPQDELGEHAVPVRAALFRRGRRAGAGGRRGEQRALRLGCRVAAWDGTLCMGLGPMGPPSTAAARRRPRRQPRPSRANGHAASRRNLLYLYRNSSPPHVNQQQ